MGRKYLNYGFLHSCNPQGVYKVKSQFVHKNTLSDQQNGNLFLFLGPKKLFNKPWSTGNLKSLKLKYQMPAKVNQMQEKLIERQEVSL